ncbi:hypothetical protein V6N13_138001 [Hibiscus sabdariffa]|uniref:Uncharacterized protein n=2 Tax=Hibiscus sabdariffa TaxID=183260 RepID=A0ABR2QC80_9ROSI
MAPTSSGVTIPLSTASSPTSRSQVRLHLSLHSWLLAKATIHRSLKGSTSGGQRLSGSMVSREEWNLVWRRWSMRGERHAQRTGPAFYFRQSLSVTSESPLRDFFRLSDHLPNPLI